MLNRKFGRWTVLEKAETVKKQKKWLCICDCGTIKTVYHKGLLRGKSLSCGCFRKTNPNNKIHGFSKTSFYSIWRGLKGRCTNKKNPEYEYYGGRGIRVQWKSFEEFKNDMYGSFLEHKKTNKYTSIERINNNGNYSKENCIWAGRLEQANNKRNNTLVKYKNEIKTLAQLARKYNISYTLLVQRYTRDKWDLEKALTLKPIIGRNQYGKRPYSV